MPQREIKFRAYFKKEKRMVQFHGFGFTNQFECAHPTLYTDNNEHWYSEKDWNGEQPEIMQFTGLKDKNGKEIYEGDIVNEFRVSRSFPEGRNIKRVVEWNDDLTLDDSYGETAVGFNLFGGALEVIGNVYENPELLKAS